MSPPPSNRSYSNSKPNVQITTNQCNTHASICCLESHDSLLTLVQQGFCSRLRNPFSPGFSTGSTNPGLKGTFSPGWKHQPGVKGASRPGQGPPRGRTLSPGWCYQPGLNVLLFFFFFWFLFLVSFFI